MTSLSLNTIETAKMKNDIVHFYDEATPDYFHWSRKMNMHYGYMRSFTDLFQRERMLEQLTLQVFDQLGLKYIGEKTVVDLGCGVGASCRTLVEQDEQLRAVGVNLVKSHIDIGKRMNREANKANRIDLIQGDYHFVPLPDRSANAVMAMESICHSSNKKQVYSEAYRMLKDGGKFVFTDCFRTKPKPGILSRAAYEGFCKNWYVDELSLKSDAVSHLKDVGFKNVQLRSIRWKVAPSVMHSPYLVLSFIIKNLLKGIAIGEENWKNLKAVMTAIVMGLDVSSFDYCIVSAEK